MSGSPYAAVDTVIFDLDGTLIDSEPDLRAALNQMLASLGRRPVTRAEVVMMVGDGVSKLVERALRQARQQQHNALPQLLPEEVFWLDCKTTRQRFDVWRWRPALRYLMRKGQQK